MDFPQMLLIVGAGMLPVIGFIWIAERSQRVRAYFNRLDPPPDSHAHGTADWDWAPRQTFTKAGR